MHLLILVDVSTHASCVDLTVILLNFTCSVTLLVFVELVPDALASSTEESFHAIQIARCGLLVLLVL